MFNLFYMRVSGFKNYKIQIQNTKNTCSICFGYYCHLLDTKGYCMISNIASCYCYPGSGSLVRSQMFAWRSIPPSMYIIPNKYGKRVRLQSLITQMMHDAQSVADRVWDKNYILHGWMGYNSVCGIHVRNHACGCYMIGTGLHRDCIRPLASCNLDSNFTLYDVTCILHGHDFLP